MESIYVAPGICVTIRIGDNYKLPIVLVDERSDFRISTVSSCQLWIICGIDQVRQKPNYLNSANISFKKISFIYM